MGIKNIYIALIISITSVMVVNGCAALGGEKYKFYNNRDTAEKNTIVRDSNIEVSKSADSGYDAANYDGSDALYYTNNPIGDRISYVITLNNTSGAPRPVNISDTITQFLDSDEDKSFIDEIGFNPTTFSIDFTDLNNQLYSLGMIGDCSALAAPEFGFTCPIFLLPEGETIIRYYFP